MVASLSLAAACLLPSSAVFAAATNVAVAANFTEAAKAIAVAFKLRLATRRIDSANRRKRRQPARGTPATQFHSQFIAGPRRDPQADRRK